MSTQFEHFQRSSLFLNSSWIHPTSFSIHMQAGVPGTGNRFRLGLAFVEKMMIEKNATFL